MKYQLSLLLLLPTVFFVSGVSAKPMTMTEYQTIANQCQDLPCVRERIDAVDATIVSSLALRLALVKRAGELKGSAVPTHDQAREDAILKRVADQAKTIGYAPDIATKIFTVILKEANVEESKERAPH